MCVCHALYNMVLARVLHLLVELTTFLFDGELDLRYNS